MDHYQQQACEVIATSLGISSAAVSCEDTADSVEAWNSLGHMRLVLTLEERLSRQLSLDEIISTQNVEGVAQLFRGEANN